MGLFLDAIYEYLSGEDIIEETETFFGFSPARPADCVMLFEQSGFSPDLHCNLEYPVLQVRVRGSGYNSARSKMESIINALHGLCEETIDGVRYLLIKAHGSPEAFKAGKSESVEIVQHFEIIKEREKIGDNGD